MEIFGTANVKAFITKIESKFGKKMFAMHGDWWRMTTENFSIVLSHDWGMVEHVSIQRTGLPSVRPATEAQFWAEVAG